MNQIMTDHNSEEFYNELYEDDLLSDCLNNFVIWNKYICNGIKINSLSEDSYESNIRFLKWQKKM